MRMSAFSVFLCFAAFEEVQTFRVVLSEAGINAADRESHRTFVASGSSNFRATHTRPSGANRSNGSTQGDYLVFKFRNKATIPVNILALSSVVRAHGIAYNSVMPGQEVEVWSCLEWYDIYMSTTKANHWVTTAQVGWGLMKDGIATGVGILVGAGVSGSIAATSGAAVTAALTSLVAPPVAIALGVVALAGVGVASTLIVSQICESLAENLAAATKALYARAEQLPEGQRLEDGVFHFRTVVTDVDVQDAYAMASLREHQRPSGAAKDKVLKDLVMTEATALAYFTALQAVFSMPLLGRESGRTFTISGGFTPPKRNGKNMIVDFMPLDIKEDVPTHGCKVFRDDDQHWKKVSEKCQEQCLYEVQRAHHGVKPSGELFKCEKDCRAFAQPALLAEQQANRRQAEFMRVQGQEVHITTDKESILRYGRAAGVMNHLNDTLLANVAGKAFKVEEVKLEDLTALLVVPGSNAGSWPRTLTKSVHFPLEVLTDASGTVVMQESERTHMQKLRFGECWVLNNEGGNFPAMRKMAGQVWKAPASRQFSGGQYKMHFGQACSIYAQDRCDFSGRGAPWYWVES